MKVIDSSCWLEYFSGSDISKRFAAAIQSPGEILLPTIILTEVFKKLLSTVTEKSALFAIAQMEEAQIIDLTPDLALEAARLSTEHKLPLADSIIYATALKYNADVYTMDKHFEGLPVVVYFGKKR